MVLQFKGNPVKYKQTLRFFQKKVMIKDKIFNVESNNCNQLRQFLVPLYTFVINFY